MCFNLFCMWNNLPSFRQITTSQNSFNDVRDVHGVHGVHGVHLDDALHDARCVHGVHDAHDEMGILEKEQVDSDFHGVDDVHDNDHD